MCGLPAGVWVEGVVHWQVIVCYLCAVLARLHCTCGHVAGQTSTVC
jgi:hypothetical protein